MSLAGKNSIFCWNEIWKRGECCDKRTGDGRTPKFCTHSTAQFLKAFRGRRCKNEGGRCRRAVEPAAASAEEDGEAARTRSDRIRNDRVEVGQTVQRRQGGAEGGKPSLSHLTRLFDAHKRVI